VKAFVCTRENAVTSQNGIAVSVYDLDVIIRKQINLSRNLSRIPQFLSVDRFEKLLLSTLCSRSYDSQERVSPPKEGLKNWS